MDGKKFIEITNNFNKNLNNLQNKINKFETIFDRKDNDIKLHLIYILINYYQIHLKIVKI